MIHNKKVTRKHFYGMLTGSGILDTVETDSLLIFSTKIQLFYSLNKFGDEKNDMIDRFLTLMSQTSLPTIDLS